jgi:hypothetical protein
MKMNWLLSALFWLSVTSTVMASQLFPAGAPYDSQLGGAYSPPTGVLIVSRDRLEAPAQGLYNICYVNVFQTQPSETDWWIKTHPELLLRQGTGWMEDPNWPDEILLDLSTDEKREALVSIIGPWIDKCADDGFDAIEADNLDTYSRSDGALTIKDNLALAQMLVERAHERGMTFGQKNGAELGDQGKAIGFDFAIVESCEVFEECQAYESIYGRYVLEIEYTDTSRRFFERACAARGFSASVILRDPRLQPVGSSEYYYAACP